MIVLVSDNAEVVTRVSTLLKQKGDLFTVAADEISAFAAIRAERATLLIVDTASSAFNGFALCRAVKDDPDLAPLPVLCLIDLTDITSLLSVLDCGGDGFLTPPVDLSSFSSAISDIQDRQAEGVGKGQVASRFRVNHDGREFSILADRRQLLEFLLAAFESAIRVRCDTEQVREDCKRELTTLNKRLAAVTVERDGTVNTLHRELEERREALASAVSTLQEKEQSEAFLKARFENVAQELRELGTALQETRKSDQEKSTKIAALESDRAAAAIETKKTEQDLNARIASLRAQLNDTTLEKDSARSTVAALDVRLAELDRQLTTVQDDLAGERETGRALTAELERVSAARDREQRNREALEASLEKTRAAALAKEQEFRSALDAMTSDMRSIQTALEQNLRQLESELSVRKNLELDVESLAKERETLSRAKDMLEEKCSRLQGDLQEAIAVSGVHEREARAALDNMTNDLGSIQSALEQNLRHLEQELKARRALEQEVNDLSRERDELLGKIQKAETGLEDLGAQLAAEKDLRDRVENDLAAARAEHETARATLGETSRSLERAQEENRALVAVQERERKAVEEISALNEKIAGQSSDLERLRQENEALAGAQERECKAAGEISALKEKIAGLTGDLEKMREENRTLGDLQEKERSATAEITNLQGKISVLVRDLEKVREENQALAAAEERGRLAARQVADLNEKIAGLTPDLEKLQEENKALLAVKDRELAVTGQVSLLKEEVAGLNRNLFEHRELLESERQKSARAMEENRNLAEKFRDVQRALESASGDLGSLNEALGKERAQREAAEGRLKGSEQASAEKNRVIALLQEELDAARPAAGVRKPVAEPREEPDRPIPPSPVVSPDTPGAAGPVPWPGQVPPAMKEDAGKDVFVNRQISAPPVISTLASRDSPVPLPIPDIPVPPQLPEEPTVPPAIVGAGGQERGQLPAPEPGLVAPPSTSPETSPPAAPYVPPRASTGDLMISRDRWLDIIKWAHHSEALQPGDRKNLIADLMRLSKLVQKGRHLTNRQEQEIRALVARVQALGYRFV